jgi:lipoprotein-anchoring transpeptidase ErfK/SrfK
VGGETLVLGDGGIALRRAHVRVARKTPRPDGVAPDHRWIHVDLNQQALVAYRGDQPVFATLVSSGKEGYEPPLGTFPIFAKHVSTTMNATDPIDGFYEVEEVPWTMYYWESYALHGAYWHNDFGKPKSHGCTNLAPPDARWLFHWSSPRLPDGWHASLGKGTKVYYSR